MIFMMLLMVVTGVFILYMLKQQMNKHDRVLNELMDALDFIERQEDQLSAKNQGTAGMCEEFLTDEQKVQKLLSLGFQQADAIELVQRSHQAPHSSTAPGTPSSSQSRRPEFA